MKNKLKGFTDENINKKIKIKDKIAFFENMIMYILIAILSVYFIMIFWSNFSKNGSDFQVNSFVVVSGSMMPTLNVNDLIFTIKEEKDKLQQGSIISFYQNDHIITHRINNVIEQDGQTYYETKGDNNNDIDDELVKYDDVVGRYLFRIPKIGYLIKNLQTQIGIVVIIVLLLIREMFTRNKENKEYIRHQKRLEMEEREKSDI